MSSLITAEDAAASPIERRGTDLSALVLGDGATGRQIALELAATHEVLLATGRSRRVSPQRVLGKSVVFWWTDRLGVLRASRETRVGSYLMKTDPFPGKYLGPRNLQRRGVRLVDCLFQVDGKSVGFVSGETAEVDAVVWATGYRDDGKWVAVPEVKDSSGGFVHQPGVSPVPGLYFIGRSWQWTRGSALLAGVGDDAAYVVDRIADGNDAASRSLTVAATTENVGRTG